MASFDHVLPVALIAAAALAMLAAAGFFLSERRAGGRVAAHLLTAVVTLAVAIVFAVTVNHAWRLERDRENERRGARLQHLERLHATLRAEADALKNLARGLHEGRDFTLAANDARQAIWLDGPLTADIERHYPDYFQERERLIREILRYDTELGRLRQIVSASLPLDDRTEPFRAALVPALVGKCAGASSAPPFPRMVNSSMPDGRAHGVVNGLLQLYEEHRCPPAAARAAQDLFDRAADLADAVAAAGDAAARYAEETQLRGSCTYAPGG